MPLALDLGNAGINHPLRAIRGALDTPHPSIIKIVSHIVQLIYSLLYNNNSFHSEGYYKQKNLQLKHIFHRQFKST